jgi:aryl-alcohol dehydrogenase-like predicted oxidoreductase
MALAAGGYTLVRQPMRERVIPAARQHDVGLVVGGPFLQGLLATIQRERVEAVLRSGEPEGPVTVPLARRLLALYDLCAEAGMAITELALRYILNDPDIHSVIPGAQHVAHLRDNLEAVEKGPLPAELLSRLEAINHAE